MLATTTNVVAHTLADQTWYILVKDIITLLITVSGLVIGGGGIATWKKQKMGEKEFEVLFNLSHSLLKLREAIKYVRNPAIWPSESSEALKFGKNKYPEKNEEELKTDFLVYEMRWEKVSVARTEVDAYLLEAEILWGKEIQELMKPLNKKIAELITALRMRFAPKQRNTNAQSSVEIDKIIYDMSHDTTKPDGFGNDVDKAIEGINSYITKIIKLPNK